MGANYHAYKIKPNSCISRANCYACVDISERWLKSNGVQGAIMKSRISHLVIVSALIFLLSDKAAAQNPVRFNWTAVTGAQSGLFMAQQENPFKKNCFGGGVMHNSSKPRRIQGLLAGGFARSLLDRFHAGISQF